MTINFLILCNFKEISKLSQNNLCHFLNFLAVTPIAEPAIVTALYFPFNFFFLGNYKLLAESEDPYKIEPSLDIFFSFYSTVTDLAKFRGLSISQFFNSAT